jgi:hypothetical protein
MFLFIAAYGLVMHTEGHAMDALVRAIEHAGSWLKRPSPLYPSSGVNGWWDEDNPPPHARPR